MGEHHAIVAVLAGGRGARLGGGKPAAALAGRPLIAHPLAAARAAGLEAVVVAKRGDPLPVLRERVVLEAGSLRHPLCGVLAALAVAEQQARPTAIVAVACDMPFVTAPLLEWLSGLHGAAVLESGGRLQPLLARYVPEQASLLRAALRRRQPLREAVAASGARVVPEGELTRFGNPARLCFNVNDAEDLRAAAAMMHRGGPPAGLQESHALHPGPEGS